MSGYRYSDYRIAQEQQERLRVFEAIRRQDEEATELRSVIGEVLADAAAGLKSTFAGEVERAVGWQATASLAAVSPQATTADAQAGQAAREATLAEGRAAHRELVTAFTRKADELGLRLTEELLDAEGRFLAVRGLLQGWLPEETRRLEEALRAAKERLASSHYREVEPLLATLSRDCGDAAERAGALQEKYQQRLYVLRGLLETCKKLGFRVVEQPAAEDLGPSTDPLRVRVDTLDRGKIDFTLGLDKIESDSNMIESYCPREYGDLSARLEESFGVSTQFFVGDEDPAPIGRARDERDIPGVTSKHI